MNDFGTASEPIARKPHKCEYCLGPIPKGEKHYHYSGMFDGEWQNWRMHAECYTDYVDNDVYGDGFAPGDGQMPERVRLLVVTA